MRARFSAWLQALVLLSSLGVLVSRPALAAVTCSTSMSALNFGTVDPASGATATANLHYTCNTGLTLGFATHVKMCLRIGPDSQVARVMTSGTASMDFQMYQGSPSGTVWGFGPGSSNPTPVSLAFDIPAVLAGTISGDVTLYGQIPAQTSAHWGSYAKSFSGLTQVSVDSTQDLLFFHAPPPPDCGTENNGSFPFTASATVAKSCTITTAGNLTIPTPPGLLLGNQDGTSTIGVNCVNGTPYNIGLDNGQHASGSARRMQGPGAALIGYELYRNSARTQRWGNTVGTDTVSGTGNGATLNTTVYGRVPAQTTPAPGVYSDTVTISVTY
jgi:spore coat protein U-like protein